MLALSTARGQDSDLKAKAFVSLTASKTTLYPGECAIINYAFSVHHDNKIPIQFTNLGDQLKDHLLYLKPAGTLIFDSNINNVEGTREIRGQDTLFTYNIYEGAVCPIKEGTLNIPSLSLVMFHRQVNLFFANMEMPVKYFTKEITIETKPIPKKPSDIQAAHYPITGKFSMQEELKKERIARNESFEYSMTIKGYGYTGHIYPQIKENDQLQVELLSEHCADYIWKDTIFAKKTFKYLITPKKEGAIKLSSVFEPIDYFDPSAGKFRSMLPEKKVVITNKSVPEAKKPIIFPSDTAEATVFLIDISESMNVEDYRPSRLEFIKSEIKELIEKRYPIEIIFFGGAVKPYLNKGTPPIPLDSIKTKWIKKNGTAIGDAIWYATRYIKNSNRKYSQKLFIVGDGDNTAGDFLPSAAAQFAKVEGFKIYPIGVGTHGSALYKGNSIDNTFSEKDFQLIAEITGGKYFRLTHTSRFSELITSILKEP